MEAPFDGLLLACIHSLRSKRFCAVYEKRTTKNRKSPSSVFLCSETMQTETLATQANVFMLHLTHAETQTGQYINET